MWIAVVLAGLFLIVSILPRANQYYKTIDMLETELQRSKETIDYMVGMLNDMKQKGYLLAKDPKHANAGKDRLPPLVYGPKPATQLHTLNDLGSVKDLHQIPKTQRPTKQDTTPAKLTKQLPASSVWCEGDTQTNLVCKIRNLCYHPKLEEFLIVKSNSSTFHGFEQSPTLSLVAIQNHSSFNWAYSEISASNPAFQDINVRFEAQPHFLLSRLIVDNVMHTLHDNAIGLYQLLKRVSTSGSDTPFSLDNRLLIVDGHLQTTATQPLTYLSRNPIRYMNYLNQDRNVVTCFNDAYVGNSDDTTWYQYGFTTPQGPIPDKQVNGYHVREYGEFVKSRIKIPYSSRGGMLLCMMGDVVDDIIVLLSRRGNRLMLNEQDLIKHMESRFNLPVVVVSNEEYGFEEQVNIIKDAKVVVGMHGSILAMILFCKKGTVIIEMYPFGVPAENYTPYKTLSGLDGMDLVYRAWENSFPPREDSKAQYGGISHLTSEEQVAVRASKRVPAHLCCSDYNWLYRIYQNSIIDLEAVSALTTDALEESKLFTGSLVGNPLIDFTKILPTTVVKATCLDGDMRPRGELWMQWDAPWNRPDVDRFSILIVDTQSEYFSTGVTTSIPGFAKDQKVWFMIRSCIGEWRSEYGPIQSCTV